MPNTSNGRRTLLIEPEALIVATILLLIAAVLSPVANRWHSRWLAVVGDVVVSLAGIFFLSIPFIPAEIIGPE